MLRCVYVNVFTYIDTTQQHTLLLYSQVHYDTALLALQVRKSACMYVFMYVHVFTSMYIYAHTHTHTLAL